MAQSSIYVDPNDLKMVNEDIQRLLKTLGINSNDLHILKKRL
jgi:flagellar biosynthesis/type III secretory pathway protein FliH